jgi:hypothetical protein
MLTYGFTQGEDIAIALKLVTGDASQVSGISAALSAVPPARASLPNATTNVCTFTASPCLDANNVLSGWILHIPAQVCATLVPGNYVADAKIHAGSGIITTTQIAITINEGVTP